MSDPSKKYRITAPAGWDEERSGPFFITYPDAEGVYHDHLAGEVVSDIPHVSIKWLHEDGLIEDASKAHKDSPGGKE